MAEPLLVLEDAVPDERPFLTINGTPYYYRHPRTLGLLDQVRVQKMGQAWEKFDYTTASDEALEEAALNVSRLAKMMLEGADEAIDGLTFNQQVQIIDTYRKVRASFNQPGNRRERRAAGRSTSARSSRPSRGSTDLMTG